MSHPYRSAAEFYSIVIVIALSRATVWTCYDVSDGRAREVRSNMLFKFQIFYARLTNGSLGCCGTKVPGYCSIFHQVHMDLLAADHS